MTVAFPFTHLSLLKYPFSSIYVNNSMLNSSTIFALLLPKNVKTWPSKSQFPTVDLCVASMSVLLMSVGHDNVGVCVSEKKRWMATTSVERQQHHSAKSFVAPGCGPMLASTCGHTLEYPLSSCAGTVFTEGQSTDKLQLFPGPLWLTVTRKELEAHPSTCGCGISVP